MDGQTKSPETPYVPTDAQKAAFRDALRAHIVGTPQRAAVKAATGVGSAAVSNWEKGKDLPSDPERIFAIEAALGLPPGDLSRHLGYVPIGASSVLSAIDSDPRLTPKDANVLRTVYRSMVSDVSS